MLKRQTLRGGRAFSSHLPRRSLASLSGPLKDAPLTLKAHHIVQIENDPFLVQDGSTKEEGKTQGHGVSWERGGRTEAVYLAEETPLTLHG